MKTQTNSSKYEGQCKFCKQDFTKRQIVEHLNVCQKRKCDFQDIKYQTETLIIGAGFAGLYLSHILSDINYDNFLVIAPNKKTVSHKSYYQFRSRGIRQDSLKETMLNAGKNKNNHQLVNLFVNNIDDELTRLSRLTELQPAYVGVKIKEPKKLLKKLEKKIKKRIFGEVIAIKKQNNLIMVKSTNGLILCKKIVFCAGGLRSSLSSIFSDEKVKNNIFDIAKKLNCKTAYLNKVMYHPFYSKNKCVPTDGLFGFEIIGANGKKLPITNRLIESHNAHFCLEEILKEIKKAGGYCFGKKGSIKIKLNIVPHYRLGGIVINKRGQTNIKNIYALGECSYGMHGIGRVGGCSLSEIIVMSRVISKEIIK